MSDFTILVTGASGLVGYALCSEMRERAIKFRPVIRGAVSVASQAAITKTIGPCTDWRVDLKAIDTVVHLAARVHMVRDVSVDALREYRIANVDATLNLARQCAEAGVRRFVYLSSIKVNGEWTAGRPFSVIDPAAPADPYGASKLEAEQGLHELSRETGLEVVVIRPPLVYGPRVRANFLQLMRWVSRGVPLPLASVDNRRSMVFVDNLVDLILRCVTHPDAPGRTFLVSDDHDVSVPELVRSLAAAMGKRSRLIHVPPSMLMMLARLVGKIGTAERLLNSLQVDIEQTKNVLNWTPPYTFESGIEKTVKYFLEQDRPDNKT